MLAYVSRHSKLIQMFLFILLICLYFRGKHRQEKPIQSEQLIILDTITLNRKELCLAPWLSYLICYTKMIHDQPLRLPPYPHLPPLTARLHQQKVDYALYQGYHIHLSTTLQLPPPPPTITTTIPNQNTNIL